MSTLMISSTDQHHDQKFNYGWLNLTRIEELIETLNNGEELVPIDCRGLSEQDAARVLGISPTLLKRLVADLHFEYKLFDMDGYSEYGLRALIYTIAAKIEHRFMQSNSLKPQLAYMHEQSAAYWQNLQEK